MPDGSPSPIKTAGKDAKRARLKRSMEAAARDEERLDRRAALVAAGSPSASPQKIIERAEALLAWLKDGRSAL